MTGASDAHKIDEIGTFATRFSDNVRCLADLIEALKSGYYQPIDIRRKTNLSEDGPDLRNQHL